MKTRIRTTIWMRAWSQEKKLTFPDPDIDPEPENTPNKVVMIFLGVEDGTLEDVIYSVVEEAERRGLFTWYVGSSPMEMKEVPSPSPLREAVTGRREIR